MVAGDVPTEAAGTDAASEAGRTPAHRADDDVVQALHALPVGVVVVDLEGVVRYANPSAEATLSWDGTPLVGVTLGLPLGDHHRRARIEVRTSPSGAYKVVELETTAMTWNDDGAVLVSFHDVTENASELRVLEARAERYALAIDGARDGLWDWDLVEGTLHLSDRWRSLAGLPDLPDDDHDPGIWLDRTHPGDLTEFLDALEAHLGGTAPTFIAEHRLRRRDGRYVWMLARGRAVFSDVGTPVRIAGSLTDISDRKDLEDQLRHEARHDSLTGLANRRLLLESIDVARARIARSRVHLAVVLLDLDRFKSVNDTHGHDVGDELLVEVATRIKTQIRPSDLAARLGGDEFAIVLTDLESVKVAARVCQRIQDHLAEPYMLSAGAVDSSGSIGFVTTRRSTIDTSRLMQLADRAMYEAKRTGQSPYGGSADGN